MLRYFAQSTFGRLGLVLAAPFVLIACLFGAFGLHQLVQPTAGATHFGSYALLFLAIGGLMFGVSWALAWFVARIAAQDK